MTSCVSDGCCVEEWTAMQSRLVYPGNGRLRLQIEMFLPADPELAAQSEEDSRRARPRRHRQSEAASVRKLPASMASFDREDGRQRLELCRDARGATPRGLHRVGQHPRDRLLVKHHLGRKQRLVMAVRPAVAFTGHVGLRQDGQTTPGSSNAREPSSSVTSACACGAHTGQA